MKKTLLFAILITLSQFSFAQAPNWLWAVTATGGSCYEQGFGISANPSGKIYMDARTNGSITLGGQSISTGEGDLSGEMDSSGNFKWLQFHTYGSWDYTYAFASDKEDNSYTGGIINSGGSGAFFDKYDSAGNQIWSFTYPAGPSPYGLAADNAENVYMTGAYSGTMNFGTTTITAIGADDIFLAKYDSNGNCKWAVTAGGVGQNDGGRGVATDKYGNVYICGAYNGTATFGSITTPASTVNYPSFFIAKYDSSGNIQWVSTATNAGFGTSFQFWNYNGLTIDTCGNTYVTGHFIDTAKFGNLTPVVSNGAEDIFVAKCLTSGQWEWVQSAGSTGSDEGEGIALDKRSDVYVTGYFQGIATFGNQTVTCNTGVSGGSYIFVAKYTNSNGDLQWVQAPTGTSSSGGQNLSVDKYGYVYVIGTVGGGSSYTQTFGASTVTDQAGCGSITIAKLDTVPIRTITPVVNVTYCPGETTTLSYTITGLFDSTNVFTAQLSDSAGSFANAINIGRDSTTTNGTITITIPANTPSGSTYLIRVVSSSPGTSSWANGCGAYFVNNVYVNDFYVTIGGNISVAVSPADTSICSGSSVTLNAFGGTSYTWSNSDTGSTILVTPVNDTTVYTVQVKNGGCTGTDSVKVIVNPAGVVGISPPSPTICAGQSVVLKASGYTSYTWSPDSSLTTATGDSTTASPTITITYTVTGSNASGCTGVAYDTITVVPVPNVPTISQLSDTLISSAATDNQWYRNDTLIPGATNQKLVIGKTTASYTVAVVNPADGCSSNSVAFITSGINQLSINNNHVTIYPNPTNGSFNFNISSSAPNVNEWSMQITDELGQIIFTRNSLNYNNVIDLSQLADGIYFITIINNQGKSVFKIIKQE